MGGREVIALIAGAGQLPVLVASAARARGHPVLAITVEGDGRDLAAVAETSYHAGFGEIRRIIEILAAHGARRCVFAGRVSRARLLREGDDMFRGRLGDLSDRGDQTVFQQVVVGLLTSAGIEVGSPLEFIGHLRVGEGVLTRRAPTGAEWDDLRVGMTLARAVAALDVGQTVVLKGGVVLAVEAAEGTDEAIRRGAGFASGVVVAKAARPQQDERFDLPAVGAQTLQTMVAVRAGALAVEAARTLLLDQEACTTLADQHGIAIVGVAAGAG